MALAQPLAQSFYTHVMISMLLQWCRRPTRAHIHSNFRFHQTFATFDASRATQ